MRIAILADIHGSLPSLEVVLHEIHKQPLDGLLVAGDMTCGPNSAEVLQRLQVENAWMVLGNNEGYLLRFDSGQAPDWWFTSHQWALNRWVYRTIDRASLNLLRSLPEQRVIALPGAAPIRMFHGSLRDAGELLDPKLHPEPLEDAFCRTTEAVLFPCNGDVGAQYAFLTWTKAGWEVEHHSVAYDRSRVRRAFEDSGLLQAGGALARAFLLSIETGRDISMFFLKYAYRKAAEAGYPDCEYVPDDIWESAAASFDWTRETA
jgi:predicted phosphodiesterase